MPGVGGPSIWPLFPMNSFYPASGGSGTISAGSVYGIDGTTVRVDGTVDSSVNCNITTRS
jgi:hypothetical protein